MEGLSSEGVEDLSSEGVEGVSSEGVEGVSSERVEDVSSERVEGVSSEGVESVSSEGLATCMCANAKDSLSVVRLAIEDLDRSGLPASLCNGGYRAVEGGRENEDLGEERREKRGERGEGYI